MPLKIINKQYDDFAGRNGTALRGNTWDKNTLTLDVELDLRINLSLSVGVIKNGNTFTLSSGIWSDLIGAFNGANIDFLLQPTGAATSTTVSFVDGVELTLTSDGGYADGSYQIGFFEITSDPEQFELFLNLSPNSVGQSNLSLIDSEVQRLKVSGVDALNENDPAIAMVQQGNKSGGSIISSPTFQRVTDVLGKKRYKLVVGYEFWLAVDSSVFNSAGAVGESLEVIAVMVTNDPSSISSVTSFKTGNTGDINENFNQQPNDYAVTSIAWVDVLSNTMQAFDYTQESRATIVINGTFDASDKFNVKFFTLPNDESEYQNLPNPIDNNLMLVMNDVLIDSATPTNITGNANDSGARVDILDFNVVNNATNIVVTFRAVPNAAFTTLFTSRVDDDRKYKLWLYLEDNRLSFNKANTVNLEIDFEDSVKNILPLGAWTDISTWQLFDHDSNLFADVPNTYLEDDILVNIKFTLPKDLENKNSIFTALVGRMIAENTTTNERFTLEELTYDISTLQNLPDGTLLLNYIEDRGFKLPATSDRHEFSVQRDLSADTPTDFGVELIYPFIVRYESWLPLLGVSNDFAGSQTNNWFPYSDDADWSVQFEYGFQTADGEYTDKKIIDIHDYDDWTESPGSSFSFKRIDGTPITKPLTDVPSIVIGTHEVDTETWNGNEYALNHVRPKNGAPQWMSTSVLNASDNNNPLSPVAGSTKGKITIGTKIITIESVFDPSKIDFSNDVTFSTRIHGSTTGGDRNNIYKEDFKLARRPLILDERGGGDEGAEDRGGVFCCKPELVLADLTNSARYRNDIKSAWSVGETVTFILKKDGKVTSYIPTSIQFIRTTDAFYTSIEWQDVLTSDGAGCYTLDIDSISAGVANKTVRWGSFDLKPYQSDDVFNGEGTARVLSIFNDVNDSVGIDFTDSFVQSSVRVYGKFGYWQTNTETKNVEYFDGNVEKIKREDFRSYELRTSLICNCLNETLLFHILSENSTWISDHNFDNPDYFIRDLPMIVKEGAEIEHFDGAREVKTVVVFESKVRNLRTHFQDNRQTAEGLAPPSILVAILTNNTYNVFVNGILDTTFDQPSNEDLEINIP